MPEMKKNENKQNYSPEIQNLVELENSQFVSPKEKEMRLEVQF